MQALESVCSCSPEFHYQERREYHTLSPKDSGLDNLHRSRLVFVVGGQFLGDGATNDNDADQADWGVNVCAPSACQGGD